MRRLLDWIRWNRAGDSELDEEIRSHLAAEAARLEAEEGLTPVEARSAAGRRFGNIAHAKEDSRAVWGFGPLDTWLQDVRFGIRLLARNPLFTLAATGSLALGIGASVAGFALLNTVLVQPLPVSEPQQLLLLRWTSEQRKELLAGSISGWLNLDENGRQASTSFSHVAYSYLKAHQSSFTDVIAFAEIPDLLVGNGGESDVSAGQYVSGNYFGGLGVRSVVGRVLAPADDEPDADAVAMVSYEGWQRRYGGSPSVVGARVLINRVPVMIVGVTPRGFHGCLQIGVEPEFTVPLSLQPRISPADGGLNDPGYWWVHVMARPRPGTSPARAANELALLFSRHVASLPVPSGPEVGVPELHAMPGAQGLQEQRGELASPLRLVTAMVGLVLLVACANVAALLLARGTVRARELSLRLAIGAGRLRLARQLLTESVVLSLLGGAAGLILAAWFVPMLLSAAQPRAMKAVLFPVQIDAYVVAFGLGLSLVAGLILGMITMVGSTRPEAAGAVRENAGSPSPGRDKLRLGKLLVVGQIALSLLLLVLAGLFAGTLRNLQRVDTGINSERLLQFRIEPGLQGYEGERRRNLLVEIGQGLEAVPGVASAGFSRHTLFSGSSAISTVVLPGGGNPVASNTPAMAGKPLAWLHMVGGRFLETLGIPLLSGRQLEERDGESSHRVALVNRTLARNFFGDENPIGKTIATGSKGPSLEIVGVVGDARYTDLRQEPPPTIYVPYAQRLPMLSSATFYVRTHRDPETVAAAVRRVLRGIDPGLPTLEVMTMEERMARATERERRVVLASTFFSTLTVLLACIGLYGLMAYAVSRRTGELGVRLALGASPRRLVLEVLRETGVVVGAGVAIGLAAAVGGNRLVRAQLFGVLPTDVFTLVAGAVVVGAVALAAGCIPARRASRVDPIAALRSE